MAGERDKIYNQDKITLAKRLVKWMSENEISQWELSKKAFLVQSVCHEIMTGGVYPSCVTIQKLAVYTDIDIRYWLIGKRRKAEKMKCDAEREELPLRIQTSSDGQI